MRGLAALTAAKRRRGGGGPELGVTCVVTPANHCGLEELFLEAIDLAQLVVRQHRAAELRHRGAASRSTRACCARSSASRRRRTRAPTCGIRRCSPPWTATALTRQMAARARRLRRARHLASISQPKTLDVENLDRYLRGDWASMTGQAHTLRRAVDSTPRSRRAATSPPATRSTICRSATSTSSRCSRSGAASARSSCRRTCARSCSRSAPPAAGTTHERRRGTLERAFARCSARGATSRRIGPRRRDRELPASFAQERLWLLDQLQPNGSAYNLAVACRLVGALDVARARAQPGRDRAAPRDPAHDAARARRRARAADCAASCAVAADRRRGDGRARGVDGRAGGAAVRPRSADRCSGRRSRAWRPREHCLVIGHPPRDLRRLVVRDLHGRAVRALRRVRQRRHLARCRRPRCVRAISPPGSAAARRRGVARRSLELLEAAARWRAAATCAADRSPAHARGDGRREPHDDVRVASDGRDARRWPRREGATLYMVLLAAFQTLLHRYTGDDDVIVGSPVAGRNHAGLDGVLGLFTNTAAVAHRPRAAQPTFRQLLGRVREAVTAAWRTRTCRSSWWSQALQPPRHAARSPLFDVMFALQNVPRVAAGSWPGLERRGLRNVAGAAPSSTSRSRCRRAAKGCARSLEYDAELFDAATIARLLGHSRTLLERLRAIPSARRASCRCCRATSGGKRSRTRRRRRIRAMQSGPSALRSAGAARAGRRSPSSASGDAQLRRSSIAAPIGWRAGSAGLRLRQRRRSSAVCLDDRRRS